MDKNNKNEETKEFEKLWEEVEVGSHDFNSTLTEKIFSLEDTSHLYTIVNRENKTEIIEAESVEEAMNKASLKDIEKISYSGTGKNSSIIDNNLLKK